MKLQFFKSELVLLYISIALFFRLGKTALFKSNWGTDQTVNSCPIHTKTRSIKCFDLKEIDDGDVIMTYKDINYTTNEFCIRINHEAVDFYDHYAEICENDSEPFLT